MLVFLKNKFNNEFQLIRSSLLLEDSIPYDYKERYKTI